jgi:class 3 adenylate cyclase/alpha-beta hydrolase superfamily lysophospholipase
VEGALLAVDDRIHLIWAETPPPRQTAVVGDVRWTRSDEHHIAFRVVEEEPQSDITVLLASGAFLPIETMWDDPGHARFVNGLAGLGRLVVFDRRGIGASDPVLDWQEPLVRQWVRDAVAVLESVDRAPVHVVGWEWGGLQALWLAAERPDLVASVTVFHGLDRPERVEEVFGLPLHEIADLLAGWTTEGDAMELRGTHVSANLYHPSRTGDPAFERWIDEAGRRGASPATAARMYRSLLTPGTGVDHRAVVAPVLSLRRRDNELGSRSVAQEIADLVPRGVCIEIPGSDTAPYSGDVDALVAEIERFVTGEAPRIRAGDRQMAAVLFTDIVGSTEAAGAVGDAGWRGVLDAHDRIVGRVIDRHGGRVVKNTGDGVLAVFDLASRAVRAAVDLRSELTSIGVEVRQGIHVGELVDRDGDIAGLAAHVAARVMSAAGPGEILTSATVPLVIDRSSMDFESLGQAELKGVSGSWELFRIRSAG